MSDEAMLSRQLRNGERVLWSAQTSAAVRDAWYRRSRESKLLRAAGGALAGGLAAWRAYESGRAWLAQPDISSALTAPILAVLSFILLACSMMFVQSYFRVGALHRITSAWHSRYVLTDQRLFSVDDKGELIDEIEGREIVAVEIDADPGPATVLVERRTSEEEEDKHMILTNLEQPLTAKAKIEETFLELTP